MLPFLSNRAYFNLPVGFILCREVLLEGARGIAVGEQIKDVAKDQII